MVTAVSLLLFVSSFAGGMMDQTGVVISKFPHYPGDEVVLSDPSRFLNHPLSLDFRNHQLVLLTTSEDGDLKILRFDLADQALPELDVDVSRDSSGLWIYRYTVRNYPNAKRPISAWFLEIPQPNLPDPRSPSLRPFPRDASPGNWYTDHYMFLPGRWSVRWTRNPGGEGLAPGSSGEEFILESDLRPGYLVASFQSSVDSMDVLDTIAPELRTRIAEALQDLSFNSKQLMTLGPKFGEEASPRSVAAEFYVGISRMVHHGDLLPDSLFVRDTLEYLQKVIDDPWVDQWRAIPDFTARPANDQEQRVYEILRLTLENEE